MPSINPEYNNYKEHESRVDNTRMPQREEREDMSIFYEYDSEGRDARRSIDKDNDGKYDLIYTLDENGRITEDYIDEDGDGKTDLHVSYEYDEQGREVARYMDFDLDGKVDQVSNFNEQGQIVSDDFDENGDGEIDFHVDYTYVYDENGNTESYIDRNLDGQPDTIATVNPEGEIIAEDVDTDGDGVLDTHVEYGKDDKGQEIVTNQTGMKAVGAEELPEGHTFKNGKIYDSEGKVIGRVVSAEKDVDGDGVNDTVDSYYLYTNEGGEEQPEEQPTTQTEHAVSRADLPDGYKIENGKIYDSEGKEIGRTEVTVKDVTGDGKTDNITRYFLYDAKGEEETTITTEDGRTAKAVNKEDLPEGYSIKDGVIYDSKNNVIGLMKTTEKDVDGDGVNDTVDSYYLYTNEGGEEQPEAEPTTQTEHAVSRTDLPDGYKIENGKIYNSEGKEIGRTEETVRDATGDNMTDTITRYFLYDTKEENTITTEDGRTAKAVNKADLPQGYAIRNGVIYDSQNNVIGLTKITQQDADGDGIPDTIESYFLYT